MQLDDNIFENFNKDSIKRGFTFRGVYPPNNFDKEHICIILNKSIKNQEDVLYFYMTSSVDSAEKIYKKDQEALILLEEKYYSKYFYKPKPTCIQCGKRHLYSIKYIDFINGLKDNSIKLEEKIDSALIELIEFAILDSKSYDPDEIKKLFDL